MIEEISGAYRNLVATISDSLVKSLAGLVESLGESIGVVSSTKNSSQGLLLVHWTLSDGGWCHLNISEKLKLNVFKIENWKLVLHVKLRLIIVRTTLEPIQLVGQYPCGRRTVFIAHYD